MDSLYSSQNSHQENSCNLSYVPRVNFKPQMNYKQRANALFEKLNEFKTNLEGQKYSKFTEVFSQIQNIEQSLQQTSKDKQQHYCKIFDTIQTISNEISSQKNEFLRLKKGLENTIDNTNRMCQNTFDKMTKERQNNQISIQKYIDFKVDSFIVKNKGVWLQQDLCDFEPYKQELNYLKKQVQQFYKLQNKQALKLKNQASESLQRQKEFLINEMRRQDYQELLNSIQGIYAQIKRKVGNLTQKRQTVEQNVLLMIENVVNSYIKDNKKFRS